MVRQLPHHHNIGDRESTHEHYFRHLMRVIAPVTKPNGCFSERQITEG